MISWYIWVGFVGFVIALLLVDLLVFQKEAHRVTAREAGIWSAIWISLGLAFGAVVWVWQGHIAGQEYLTGYLIEKSLSVDNLFVFVIIFQYFNVPQKYQHRVLFWGIFGALIFRGIFIGLGAVLLSRFSWIAFIFGAFLVYTGIRMARHQAMEVHPEDNAILNFVRRFVPVTNDYRGQRMFVRERGHTFATPLFAVLIVVETTDVVFAVDSIPAIFGVTDDPFIVFTSNAFALLGLRALYFLLADLVARFRYLSQGLALVLSLVGLKMIYEEAHEQHWLPEALAVEIPTWAPLIGVTLIIGGAIWFSARNPRSDDEVAAEFRHAGERAGDHEEHDEPEPDTP